MKSTPICTLLIVLAITSCAGTGINVPAIEGSAGQRQLPGKIIWHELLTDSPAATERFYGGLFGWEFEPLADPGINYRLIMHRGKAIGGMIDETRLPTQVDISQWVSLFSVADIHAAVEQVASARGTVFTPPTSLGDRGQIAVVADPQGALFALLQTRDGDPVDDTVIPTSGDFLWNELWTVDIDLAADFYGSLAPYELEVKTLGGADKTLDYRILSTSGHKRAGLRENPVENLPPIWVNYLRVADESELASILGKVESLGGEILVPAVNRPGGGAVAIIAGPSGAGIALQTWDDGQQIQESVETQP